MKKIKVLKRDMTAAELDRMRKGFDEHTLDNDVLVQTADRFSFTAVLDQQFVGCSSGLAYKNGAHYSGWFYLSDLYVEKDLRAQGLGRTLLNNLEKEIQLVGVTKIWTWTAGYEAPGFYQRLGYEIFAEMETWYSDGSSRVGLMKKL